VVARPGEVEGAIVALDFRVDPERPSIFVEKLHEGHEVEPEAGEHRALEGDQTVRCQVEQGHEQTRQRRPHALYRYEEECA